jgi:DNA-binding transcriptional MerR regulator
MDMIEKGSRVSTTVDMPITLVDSEYVEKLQKLPNKMAFKIGEVADILGVKQYVLRYWETEFPELNPQKSGNNQRMYTRKNVETALLIQKLLHRDRFSIEGARKYLSTKKHEIKRVNEVRAITQDLSELRKELKSVITDMRSLRKLFTV